MRGWLLGLAVALKFQEVDLDEDERLSREELERHYGQPGVGEAMLHLYDRDGDQRLTEQEAPFDL
jgi:hypothetical protein